MSVSQGICCDSMAWNSLARFCYGPKVAAPGNFVCQPGQKFLCNVLSWIRADPGLPDWIFYIIDFLRKWFEAVKPSLFRLSSLNFSPNIPDFDCKIRLDRPKTGSFSCPQTTFTGSLMTIRIVDPMKLSLWLQDLVWFYPLFCTLFSGICTRNAKA